MARGKKMTVSEDQMIRLMLRRGSKVPQIADYLGRARASIYKRIGLMKKTGEIEQLVLEVKSDG